MALIRSKSRQVIPATIALMLTGLFFSRALLSVGMFTFILASLLSEPFSVQYRTFLKTPFRWSMSVLFFIPFLTILWSDNKQHWLEIMADKLPLLAVPFCSLALARISDRDNRRLLIFFMVIAMVSMSRTIWQFALNASEITDAYLKAKVLTVDMGNDHVRYGWVLGLSFSWVLHLLLKDDGLIASKDRNWMITYLFFTAIFLHLLASKTGLACLWLSVAIAIAFNIRRSVAKWMVLFSMVLPLASWWIMPTLRNRLRFVWWDFQHYSRGGYTEGLSDTPRILSIRAGGQIVMKHPLTGTGFGDLRAAINQWYTEHAPYLQSYEQLLPSNEFVLHAAAAGIPGTVIFCFAVCYPLFLRGHRRVYGWISMHALALIGFLYEIGLETQYGIFVYTMMCCYAFHLIQKETENPSDPVNIT